MARLSNANGKLKGCTMANLLSAESVSKIMELSKRQIFRLNAMEKIPKSLKINGAVRWDAQSISDWISMGCPDRKEFEARQKAGAGV